ncbi:MAG: O-antigen ligase family protein [Gemmatimonadales bacterium]
MPARMPRVDADPVVARPFVIVSLLLLAILSAAASALPMAGFAFGLLLIGLGVFAGWAVHKILYRESWSSVFRNPLVLPAVLFAALVALSMLWAEYPRRTYVGAITVFQLLALALLLIDTLNKWERVEWLVRVLIAAALMTSILMLWQYFVGGVHRAGDNLAGGQNTTAMLLVTLLPFSFYMIRSAQTPFWKVLGISFFLLATLAVQLSFSRMNMLLLPIVMVSQFWLTWRQGRGRPWLAMAIAGTLAVGVLYAPWERLERRAETILPYLQASIDNPGGRAVEKSSARGYHLRVGLAIFADHPVLGVGYRNYGEHFLRLYQFEVEGSEEFLDTVRSPHSSTVGIMADLGLVGTGLWLWLLSLGLYLSFKAWRMLRRTAHRSDSFFLVQAVASAYLLQALAYPWYTPNQDQKLFWMILALTVVTYRLSHQLLARRGSLAARAVDQSSHAASYASPGGIYGP